MLHQNKIKLGLCVSLVRFFCEGKEMNFFTVIVMIQGLQELNLHILEG